MLNTLFFVVLQDLTSCLGIVWNCIDFLHSSVCKVSAETWVQSLGWEGFSWRWKWQPTPVFLPGESHGQRSLADCSLWDHKSQTRLSAVFLFLIHNLKN